MNINVLKEYISGWASLPHQGNAAELLIPFNILLICMYKAYLYISENAMNSDLQWRKGQK